MPITSCFLAFLRKYYVNSYNVLKTEANKKGNNKSSGHFQHPEVSPVLLSSFLDSVYDSQDHIQAAGRKLQL